MLLNGIQENTFYILEEPVKRIALRHFPVSNSGNLNSHIYLQVNAKRKGATNIYGD